jgi:hypothetical protein
MKRIGLYIALIPFLLWVFYSLVTPKMHKPMRFDSGDRSRFIIRAVNTSLDVLKQDIGSYPSSVNGLSILLMRPEGMGSWDGPYLRKPVRNTDYWGQKWIYLYPHHCNINVGYFAFYSVVKNGIDECMSGDDIFIEMEVVSSK